MSRKDFELCTPIEFSMIYDTWVTQEKRREQGEWERIRWVGVCSLQPWSKKKLTPKDIAVFPWETECKEINETNKKSLTPNEEKARYEEIRRMYGLS